MELQRPSTSELTDKEWKTDINEYYKWVDKAYDQLDQLTNATITLSPSDGDDYTLSVKLPGVEEEQQKTPAELLIETFRHGLIAEAQMEFILRTAMGVMIAKMVEAGVPLEKIVATELPGDPENPEDPGAVARELAGKAVYVHKLLRIPGDYNNDQESLAQGLRKGTFPILGIEGAIFAMASLKTGEKIKHDKSIVAFKDAPPHPLDPSTFANAKDFLDHPGNPTVAVNLFKAAYGAVTSPRARIDRKKYHYHLGGLFNPKLKREILEQHKNAIGVRESFGEPMTGTIATAVRAVPVPPHIGRMNIDAFANNIVGFTKH